MAIIGANIGQTVKIRTVDSNGRSEIVSYGNIEEIYIDSSGTGASEELIGIALRDSEDSVTVLAFSDKVIAEFETVRDARYGSGTPEELAAAKKLYNETITRLEHACKAIAATDKWGSFDFPAYCRHLILTMRDKRTTQAV